MNVPRRIGVTKTSDAVQAINCSASKRTLAVNYEQQAGTSNAIAAYEYIALSTEQRDGVNILPQPVFTITT